MNARTLVAAGLIVLAVQVVGCGSPDTRDGEVAGSRVSQAAGQAGCRTVCATCAPGTVCPHNCRLECPSGVMPCGDVLCRGNDVCCNESCSVCTHPGHACPQQVCAPAQPCVDTVLCIRGFHWSPQLCICVPDLPGGTQEHCAADADCRLFADYCTGCDCRSLSSDQPDPVCSGPGVRCFADPCLGETAICVEGQCTLTPSTMSSRRRPPRPARAPHSPHHPAAPRHPAH